MTAPQLTVLIGEKNEPAMIDIVLRLRGISAGLVIFGLTSYLERSRQSALYFLDAEIRTTRQ